MGNVVGRTDPADDSETFVFFALALSVYAATVSLFFLNMQRTCHFFRFVQARSRGGFSVAWCFSVWLRSGCCVHSGRGGEARGGRLLSADDPRRVLGRSIHLSSSEAPIARESTAALRLVRPLRTNPPPMNPRARLLSTQKKRCWCARTSASPRRAGPSPSTATAAKRTTVVPPAAAVAAAAGQG